MYWKNSDGFKRKAIGIDCLSYNAVELLTLIFFNMPTNISENKWIGYSSSDAYVSLNELTMLEETEKIVTRLPRSGTRNDTRVTVCQEQKLPDFYELKIRVRKYDFL
jgi:hypothetical protein